MLGGAGAVCAQSDYLGTDATTREGATSGRPDACRDRYPLLFRWFAGDFET
jgi:hypothetical protein